MWSVRLFVVALTLFASASANAQRGEVAITLNEQFFNAFIDSVFANFDPPEFPIAQLRPRGPTNLGPTGRAFAGHPGAPSPETIKILRESGGVRTSVHIGGGRINVPLAFSGTYSPPFVGCIEFAGWADTNIDLEFDRDSQRLIGRATVAAVNLNGTGGIGSSLIAKMVQGSLDKKMNPIEILRLEKLSFGIPVQNAGNLRLHATGVRPEISPGLLTLHIDYEFLKG
jgi:hypothetical protein